MPVCEATILCVKCGAESSIKILRARNSYAAKCAGSLYGRSSSWTRRHGMKGISTTNRPQGQRRDDESFHGTRVRRPLSGHG
jgi:hypothetical protein